MNLSAYTRAINGEPESKPAVEVPATVQLGVQQHINWIVNPQTQHFFKQVSSEIEKLESEARALAVQYPQHQNPFGIVHRLVRAEELRNIIKTYGRQTDSTTTQER